MASEAWKRERKEQAAVVAGYEQARGHPLRSISRWTCPVILFYFARGLMASHLRNFFRVRSITIFVSSFFSWRFRWEILYPTQVIVLEQYATYLFAWHSFVFIPHHVFIVLYALMIATCKTPTRFNNYARKFASDWNGPKLDEIESFIPSKGKIHAVLRLLGTYNAIVCNPMHIY